MSKTAAKATQVDKIKDQMMKVMGITDPSEFQRIAKDYCKEMAVELMLPAYMRIFSRINKRIDAKKEMFTALTKRSDMIAHVLKNAMEDEEIVEILKTSFETEDKESSVCPELSGDKRTAGNAAFQKKKDRDALNLYSEAVFAADVTSEQGRKDCALALANRSAVWVRLEKYRECLDDIEGAVVFHYPDNMLYKLMDRKAKCLAALGEVEEAASCYNRVSLLLAQSGLEQDKLAAWRKDIKAELEKLKSVKQRREEKPGEAGPDLLLPERNKTVPQLSSAVELAYNPLVGRHAVASRDIQAGEVVMVDSSLASHLLCATRTTNCAHCTVRVDPTKAKPSPLTRPSRFCSVGCLKVAMESHHPVEAKVNISKLFWNKKEEKYEELSGTILLSYRCITQKPLEFFLEQAADYDNVDDMFGVEFSNAEERLECGDYRNLWNLTAHRDRKTKDELLSLSIRTAVFIVLLRYGGYFGAKETPYGASLSSAETVVAGMIFHIQEGITYNLHQVCGVVSDSSLTGVAAPHVREFGTALFPTLLLFNHACDTNTLRININGDQVLMVAKRKIRAGEEVSDNYGIHYLSLTLEERQEALLKGFAFCCWCEGCQKDYPRMKSLRSQLPEETEDKFDHLRENIKETFRRGNHQECLKTSQAMIQLLEKAKIPPPHRNYELASISLISCLWKVYGNKA